MLGDHLLLVVDHEQALGLGAQVFRHVADRAPDLGLGGSGSAILGSLGIAGEDPGGRATGPGTADRRASARPAPISSRQ